MTFTGRVCQRLGSLAGTLMELSFFFQYTVYTIQWFDFCQLSRAAGTGGARGALAPPKFQKVNA